MLLRFIVFYNLRGQWRAADLLALVVGHPDPRLHPGARVGTRADLWIARQLTLVVGVEPPEGFEIVLVA